jgi:hypothetical protein
MGVEILEANESDTLRIQNAFQVSFFLFATYKHCGNGCEAKKVKPVLKKDPHMSIP